MGRNGFGNNRWVPLRERFLRMVDIGEDASCWLFLGSKTGRGYGRYRVNGVGHNAHKASYLLFIGKIPDGIVVRHKCDNPSCVNPSHLELGTHQDNMNDRRDRQRGARGDRYNSGTAKLNPVAVAVMRHMYSRGLKSQSALGRAYGVTQGAVWRVVHGKNWGYLSAA